MSSRRDIGGLYVNGRKHPPRRDEPTIAQVE